MESSPQALVLVVPVDLAESILILSHVGILIIRSLLAQIELLTRKFALHNKITDAKIMDYKANSSICMSSAHTD